MYDEKWMLYGPVVGVLSRGLYGLVREGECGLMLVVANVGSRGHVG